jgi:hypothetical protein
MSVKAEQALGVFLKEHDSGNVPALLYVSGAVFKSLIRGVNSPDIDTFRHELFLSLM